MSKWLNQDFKKGVRFGFRLNFWAERVVYILAGIAIGSLFVLRLVYA